jgi:hypothetical protein
MQVDENIFSNIEKKAFDYLLSQDAPKSIKDDIKNTLNNKSKKLEISIIEASKKYAGFMECRVNQKVFSEMYDVPLNQIILSLEEKRKHLKSLDSLMRNEDYKKYLAHIRRLSHSMRWNQQTRIFPISVMSHLVLITFISYII